MKLKLIGLRSNYRRTLGDIRKSSILGPLYVSNEGRVLTFDFKNVDESVMSKVLFEYISSQNLDYEEL